MSKYMLPKVVKLSLHSECTQMRHLTAHPISTVHAPLARAASAHAQQHQQQPLHLLSFLQVAAMEIFASDAFKMTGTPTLGCQIAPSYNHQSYPYDSSDTSEDEIEEPPASDIGVVVTGNGPPTRPATLRMRTRSSRKENQLAPVGFFDHAMSGVRLHVLKLWLRTNFILAVAIMGFLCLFWGALFKQVDNIHKLNIWVVDFDGQAPYNNTSVEPFVGPFVTTAIKNLVEKGGTPGYTIVSPARFDYDPMKVRESVYDFHAWAAVIINPNATVALKAAVDSGDSKYDPIGACQIVYNSARDQTTAASYLVPSLNVLQKVVVSDFGGSWLYHLVRLGYQLDNNILMNATRAISPGIEFSVYDLRPFGPPIATPAVSIGLIYLISKSQILRSLRINN